MSLKRLGWSPRLDEWMQAHAKDGWALGRVVGVQKGVYTVRDAAAEYDAAVAGRLRHEATDRSMLPVVGDWVAFRPPTADSRALIQSVLTRTGCFARQAAGEATRKQVLAANIDTVFLVSGLDGDFNLRRIERYVMLAYQGDVKPVVILNKSDLRDDIDACTTAVVGIAPGIPVHAISASDSVGLEALDTYLTLGKTVALLGSSGAGKSTIVNRLLGEERQRVATVREHDDRGQHTTTSGVLLALPGGANLIDTPGLRELQMWADESAIDATFPEIAGLAALCRYRDCTHNAEPRCGVQQALKTGDLDRSRFASYQQLLKEVRFQAEREDQSLRSIEQKRWKTIHRSMRQRSRTDPKRRK